MRSINKLLVTVALTGGIALGTISANGQQTGLSSPGTSSVKGVELKGKAPVNHETLKVNLPANTKTDRLTWIQLR